MFLLRRKQSLPIKKRHRRSCPPFGMPVLPTALNNSGTNNYNFKDKNPPENPVDLVFGSIGLRAVGAVTVIAVFAVAVAVGLVVNAFLIRLNLVVVLVVIPGITIGVAVL